MGDAFAQHIDTRFAGDEYHPPLQTGKLNGDTDLQQLFRLSNSPFLTRLLCSPLFRICHHLVLTSPVYASLFMSSPSSPSPSRCPSPLSSSSVLTVRSSLPRCAVVTFARKDDRLLWEPRARQNTGGLGARVGDINDAFKLHELSCRALALSRKNENADENKNNDNNKRCSNSITTATSAITTTTITNSNSNTSNRYTFSEESHDTAYTPPQMTPSTSLRTSAQKTTRSRRRGLHCSLSVLSCMGLSRRRASECSEEQEQGGVGMHKRSGRSSIVQGKKDQSVSNQVMWIAPTSWNEISSTNQETTAPWDDLISINSAIRDICDHSNDCGDASCTKGGAARKAKRLHSSGLIASIDSTSNCSSWRLRKAS